MYSIQQCLVLMSYLVLLTQCRPHESTTPGTTTVDPTEIHHRVKRYDLPRRRIRDFHKLNDEELYRYVQLRSLYRFVLYSPKPDDDDS